MVDFEGGFAVNHHNDTQFFAALGAEWFGEGTGSFETGKVRWESVNEAFDDSAFTCFEVTEEQESAIAFDVDYLACFQFKLTTKEMMKRL